MKKIFFTCLTIITVTSANAQWVNIPDMNFRDWLNSHGFASCLNGNMMDTTCSAIVTSTAINFGNYNIQRLDGIEFFDSLKTLNCSNNHLDSLFRLPLSLTSFNCSDNVLTFLPNLPNSLKIFDCSGNDFDSLPNLPSSLTYLDCKYNSLTFLPNLPISLKVLECDNNYLTSIPALPPSLTKFYCGSNNLTSLPVLPSTIDSLACIDNQLTSLPALTSSIRHIWCYNNQLTSLPPLPSSLYNLQCGGNQLSSLPSLPALLFSLVCSSNQLVSLPVLPAGLLTLQTSNNLLTSLPSLPASLLTIYCNSNQLTSLPDLPPDLVVLNCYNNQLTELPELPDSMAELRINDNPNLVCFPKYKKINNLFWSNTGITCRQNNGTIINATPAVNGLPICTSPAATITPAGPLTFCSGGSVILNANTGAGFTYKWIKNGSEITGATNQSYSAASSGNYTVEVTQNCGFATSSAVPVTVNSVPSATISPSGSTTFCSGGNVILNVPTGANKTYQWKKGGTDIAGATLSSYIATTGGNYKVTVTNTVTGCSKTTTTGTMATVNASPSATITPQGPTTFCAGGSVLLKGNPGTGLTYQWKKGGNNIMGATNKNYTATLAGVYKIKVTNSYGCSKLSTGITVTVPCRDEAEGSTHSSETSISVFPNPAHSEINVLSASKEYFEIEIVNALGEILITGKNENRIDISDLPRGVYFVKVFCGNNLVTEKFVKQ